MLAIVTLTTFSQQNSETINSLNFYSARILHCSYGIIAKMKINLYISEILNLIWTPSRFSVILFTALTIIDVIFLIQRVSYKKTWSYSQTHFEHSARVILLLQRDHFWHPQEIVARASTNWTISTLVTPSFSINYYR